MIKCIWGWFSNNSDALTGLASVAGVIVAFVGFWLTVKQLRQAQIALKASNTYTIQKDARELSREMMANSAVNDFIKLHDPKKKYDPKIVAEAQRCLAVIFNFYLSVFRQYETRGISIPVAQSMGRDFATFFSNAAVRAYYDKQMKGNVYDEEHERMVKLWGSSRS